MSAAILESLRERLTAARDGVPTEQINSDLSNHARGLRAGLSIAIQAVEWELHVLATMAGETPTN